MIKINTILNFFLLFLFGIKAEQQFPQNYLIVTKINKVFIPKELKEEIEKYPNNNDYEINPQKATKLREVKLNLCMIVLSSTCIMIDIYNLIEKNYSKSFFNILSTAWTVYNFKDSWDKIISLCKK